MAQITASCPNKRKPYGQKAVIKTLILGKLYLFAMQNFNYEEFCLAVSENYYTFASEYIFYIKLCNG